MPKTLVSLYEQTARELKQRVTAIHKNEGWIEAYPIQCTIVGKDFLEEKEIHILFAFQRKTIYAKNLYRLIAHVYKETSHKAGEDLILIAEKEYADLGKDVAPHLKMTVRTDKEEIHPTIHFYIEADALGVKWYPQTPITRIPIINPEKL
ncbi:MAG: hypothetical protein AAB870_01985 [Patescibacteria group bacterium]